MKKSIPKAKSPARGARFNAVDFALLLAVLAILVSVALRFIPFDRIAGKKATYSATFSVETIDRSAYESSGLAEGSELRFADGTYFGRVTSVSWSPSVYGSQEGAPVPYPEGSLCDMVISVSCELLTSDSTLLAANGEPVSAGKELELYGRLFFAGGRILSLVPQG